MKRPDWRLSAAYDSLRALSPADLAWEFLRRNHQYDLEFKRLDHAASKDETEAFLIRWGLRFPD